MKIDFKKLIANNIDGNPITVGEETGYVDISKELGNYIYSKTQDIGELELARSIYLNGEVEIDKKQAIALVAYIRENFVAFVQVAIIPQIEEFINEK